MDLLKSLTLENVQVLILAALVIITGLVSIAEILVRLTPTKSDDGAVKRIGARIDKLLDLAKVPNNKKSEPPMPGGDK